MRGCRDIHGVLAAARRAVVSDFARLAHVYGFREVETPILERSSLYARALGTTSDVVSSELYYVAGGDLVLRPEGTASAVRSLVAHGVTRPGSPGQRVWYTGAMFRHERPQRLRLRQFTQLGAEVVGESAVTADVDAIAFAERFLRSRTEATLVLNTLGSPHDRKRFNAALREHLSPRYTALSELSRKRFDGGNCMRVLDSKLAEDRDALIGAPSIAEFISSKERARFDELLARLNEENVRYRVDHTLVRGLDYYTSTAFEFVVGKRAVAAGGRYADLHGLSGVGFAVGLERVEPKINADASAGALHAAVVVLPVAAANAESATSEVGQAVRRVTRQLRAADVRAVAKLEAAKLGKQISRAIKAEAAAVVLIGSSDIQRGLAKVKVVDATRPDDQFMQHDVRFEDIVLFCRNNIGTVHTAGSAELQEALDEKLTIKEGMGL